MALTRTANPALNKNTFRDFTITDPSRVMTLQGTVNKILLMVLLLLAGAFYTWRTFFEAMQTYPETARQSIMVWMIGGGIGGGITALVTIFKRTWELYAAFGLMVTLIWLYIEILRLLARIAGRRN